MANHATVLKTAGLSQTAPGSHPLLWTLLGTRTRPDWLRWMWHPYTGEMYVGRVIHHNHFLGKKKMTELSEWARGFFFPRLNLLAIRTYFCSRDPYHQFNEADLELDRQIVARISSLLIIRLPRAQIVSGVDNQWLEKRFPGMCQW